MVAGTGQRIVFGHESGQYRGQVFAGGVQNGGVKQAGAGDGGRVLALAVPGI